jgi:hypothetical protein
MKLDTFKFLVEYNAFGVCTRAGERLGMPIKNIRLFFIYASCLTIGSPSDHLYDTRILAQAERLRERKSQSCLGLLMLDKRL